ncbi:MAG: lipocalin family protein [Gammaproteobacteria bacterium]|nr:lipocalin family protein [Gammaproteobacteria bacterium]MBU2478000.1 lipocalin family protein [Gammaproteobacteria bacterium]
MHRFLIISLATLLFGCQGLPQGVQPVTGFEVNRYLGTWYEIARLDHSFERGLSKVTADYSLREDGGLRVLNRGYSVAKNTWKDAEGKAYFVGSQDVGHLKVSFFGPFYGTYAVFELDKDNYQYAFVSGPDTSYLWLLSRTPTVSQALLDRFIEKAKALGFDTDSLIIVDH